MKCLFASVALVFVAPNAPAFAERPDPVEYSIEIPASVETAWEVLTTSSGASSYFATQALVEPRIGGAYEMYFFPDSEPGQRGSEGARILAFEPPNRLMYSWNAPRTFGPLRGQFTVVDIALTPLEGGRTRIDLRHDNWGEGEDWQAVRDYFAAAWQRILGRLQYSFEHGPVDWTAIPDGANYFRPAPASLTSEQREY